MRVPDELSRQIHPQADFYVVDSMSSVGYRTGDIIAIKRTPDATEGDIVMARIGTEITLKCFHRPADDRVELKPCSSNPEHRPIVIDERTEDREIVGVVVGAMIGPPPQSLPGPRALRRTGHCRDPPGPFRGSVWPPDALVQAASARRRLLAAHDGTARQASRGLGMR